MAAAPYIGSKLSLISNSDIRYEGILYTINTQESTIALKSVRCCGTEGRRSPEIPPSSEIYDFIIFRGQDIKDLTVLESANPALSAQLNDPAIMSVNQRPAGSAQAGKGGGKSGAAAAVAAAAGAGSAGGYGGGAGYGGGGGGYASRSAGASYGSNAGYGSAGGNAGWSSKGASSGKASGGKQQGYSSWDQGGWGSSWDKQADSYGSYGRGATGKSAGGSYGGSAGKSAGGSYGGGGKGGGYGSSATASYGKGSQSTGKDSKGKADKGSAGKGKAEKSSGKGKSDGKGKSSDGKGKSGGGGDGGRRTGGGGAGGEGAPVGELIPQANDAVKKECEEDFDYTTANVKFDKVGKEDAVEEKLKPLSGYDKGKSFFDNISCEATECAGEAERPKMDRNKAKQSDRETFGDTRRPPRPAGGRRGGKGGARRGARN